MFDLLFFQEFLRSTVDLADLIGLYVVMMKIAGKGDLKVLVAGLGQYCLSMCKLSYRTQWNICESTRKA
jgi:hypothetical protein